MARIGRLVMKATKVERKIYATTFCNFGHYVDTGRPIDHECHILSPKALRAEMAGDYDTANYILTHGGKGPIVRGRRWKGGAR